MEEGMKRRQRRSADPSPFTACRKRRHGRSDTDRHWRVLRHRIERHFHPRDRCPTERIIYLGGRGKRGVRRGVRVRNHRRPYTSGPQ